MGVRRAITARRGRGPGARRDRGGAQLPRAARLPARPSCPGSSRTTSRSATSSSWSAAGPTRPTASTRRRWRERRPFTALVLAGSRGAADPVAAAAGLPRNAWCRPAVCRCSAGCSTRWPRHHPSAASSVTLEDPAIADPELRLRPLGDRIGVAARRCDAEPQRRRGHRRDARPVPAAGHHGRPPAADDRDRRAFHRGGRGPGADVAAGLTALRRPAASYPDSRRTWLRFRDERYSGANLFALMTPEAVSAVRFWRRVEADRKRPWRIARAFGWAAAGLRPGPADAGRRHARVSRVMGCEARAIALPFAEAAIDVDKPADLALVEAILARRALARYF